MKKIFILIAVFLTTFTLTAQFEWVGDFGQSSETSGFYKTSNNQFIITRDAEDDAGFSVVDSSGNLIFNYSDPFNFNPNPPDWVVGQIRQIYDFVELADSSYLFILYITEDGCSPFNFNDENYYQLLKFDKNWNEINLSISTLPVFYGLGIPEYLMAPLPDGGFLLLSEGWVELQRRNGEGELIWEKDPPDQSDGILDFLTLSGDTTVILTYHTTYLLDGQGNVIESYQYVFDKIKPAPDGNFYGILDDTLFLLTPTLELLDNMTLPAIPRDFASSDSILAILTPTNTIFSFDHDFNSLDSIQVDDYYPLEYVEALPQGIIVSGTAAFGIWRSETPFLKEVSNNGVFTDNSKDIGITNVEAIGTPVISDPDFVEYQLTYDSLRITVQNFGDSTVDSLKLNSSFPDIWLEFEPSTTCIIYQRPFKKYNNLSLLPGESIDLYWRDFSIVFEESPEDDFEICVWTSLPNKNIDNNPGNDLFCTDFLVTDKEAIPTDFSWNLFPNPVNDYLNIQMEAPLKGCKDCLIRIMDISGRERFVNNMDHLSQAVRIPVWDWAAGLYFIQYIGDEGIFETSRFVVIK